jgi:hypothetical protein
MTRKHPSARQQKKHDAEERRVTRKHPSARQQKKHDAEESRVTRKHPSARQQKKHDAEERRVEQISAALKGYYTEKEVRELLQQKREAEQAALKEQRKETLKKQAEKERAERDKLALQKLRTRQIDRLLRLLKPPPAKRDDCQKHIEELLDSMASVKRDAETKQRSDTAIRKHIATLRKLKETGKAAGMTFPSDATIDWAITWSASRLQRDTTGRLRALHTRPSPTAAAVALAGELVTGWGGGADAVTEYCDGLCHRVGAALLGCKNQDIDLRRQIRNLKKQLATRKRISEASVSSF